MGVGNLRWVFVKICGITNEEDALLAVAMGADALGFVFAPSPRQVTPNRAHEIVRRLPGGVLTVGVFRDESPERVVEATHAAGLKAAQLHGHEGPRDSAWVAERVPMTIQAMPVGDPRLERITEFGAGAVLIDGTQPGGGEVFDWSLLELGGLPRLILAGGLNPDNVGDAISRVRPWGVDVSTGVEASPGHKDPTLVRRFISRSQAAFDALADQRRAEHPPPSESPSEGVYDWRTEISEWRDQ